MQNIITKNFHDETAIFVNFKELMKYTVLNIQIDDYMKQKQPILK